MLNPLRDYLRMRGGSGGRGRMVVNHGLREPRRGSSRLQLVRSTEELLGEDGPGGPERGADHPVPHSCCSRTGRGSVDLSPVWAGRQPLVVGEGTGTQMTSG